MFSGSVLDDDRWGDIYEDMPAKRKLALYDYDPQVRRHFYIRLQISLEITPVSLVANRERNILRSLLATKPTGTISRPSNTLNIG